MVIAVLNSKGGIGKTTLAVGLSAALAAPDRRVLIVDLDSQASASHWCGVSRNQLRPSSASVLLEKYPILKAIRHTAAANLDLLTGSVELANADLVLAGVRGREWGVRRMLERVAEAYELIIVDCPPGLSLLTVNAIVAAHALVIPVAAEPVPVEAVEPLLASIDRVRKRMQVRPALLGLAVNLFDPRRPVSREAVERLRAEYRDQVFHTEIRWTAAVAQAPQARRPPEPSDAFRGLGGEILHRAGALLADA